MKFFIEVWEKAKANKSEVLSLGLIFALALILRAIALINCGGMWGDEQATWLLAKEDSILMTIANSYLSDLHTPLYFSLLHIWIKLFGDEVVTMRWLNYCLTLPLVPFGYYAAKRLFNKTAAFYAAIFLAINTFCIYYCVEIRMYALNLILSLMSAYFFVRYVEDFKKRDSIGYIISVSLLMYNFAMTPLLAFCYLVVGFIYVLIYKKEFLKKFLASQGIAFIVCLPAIIFIILIAHRMHYDTLVSYPQDIFRFGEYGRKLFLTILENFFSFENYQIKTTNIYGYIDFGAKLNPNYLICVLAPIVISTFGLIKALISKNKNLYLIFLPSILFFIILYIVSAFDLAVIQTRYLTMIYPAIAITLAFGLSDFKEKMASYIIFGLCVVLPCFNMVNMDGGIFNIQREGGSQGIETIMRYKIKLKPDDILFIPFVGNELEYYIRHKNCIPFYTNKLLCAGEKKFLLVYFGDEYKKVTRKNAKEYFKDEVFSDTPHKTFEDNLNNGWLKPMKKGQRLIFVDNTHDQMRPMTERKEHPLTKENYMEYEISDFLYSKMQRDCFLVLKKYLKETQFFEMNGMGIFIFEKE